MERLKNVTKMRIKQCKSACIMLQIIIKDVFVAYYKQKMTDKNITYKFAYEQKKNTEIEEIFEHWKWSGETSYRLLEFKLIETEQFHYKKGLYLIINNHSATYLPGVWEEHFSDDPDEVLNNLAKKALNRYRDVNWKAIDINAIVKIYDSFKYKSIEYF